MIAHAPSLPADTEVILEPKPVTATGVAENVVPPLPSCPDEFSPQQYREPAAVIPQVKGSAWLLDALSCVKGAYRGLAADNPVGDPGTVAGTKAAETPAGPGPWVLEAVTEKVYEVPATMLVTIQLVAPVVLQTWDPGLEVTVYPVIALDPFEAGAVQVMVASAEDPLAIEFMLAAETAVGAPGGAAGIMAEEAMEEAPAPAALAAVTVKV